jgi:5'-deoxynucleotidase YfbR-like HD superfamily hydrolase
MLLYTKHVSGEPDQEWAMSRPIWHDLSDYDLVDVTPHDNVSAEERLAAEWHVVQWCTEHLAEQGARIREYWKEGNLRGTREQAVQYQLDKLEPCVEALRLERKFPQLRNTTPPSLDDFYPYAREKLTCPVLIRIIDKLQLRKYQQDPRLQYNLLLQSAGDLEQLDYMMKN